MSVPPGVDRHPVEHGIASALLQVVDDPSVADVARLDVVVERIEGLGQGVDVIHDPGTMIIIKMDANFSADPFSSFEFFAPMP